MDSLLHLFKKKNTQQFYSFHFYIINTLVNCHPLISENASTNENNSRQTVVEFKHNSGPRAQTTQA